MDGNAAGNLGKTADHRLFAAIDQHVHQRPLPHIGHDRSRPRQMDLIQAIHSGDSTLPLKIFRTVPSLRLVVKRDMAKSWVGYRSTTMW
jgi:hypothetical protein